MMPTSKNFLGFLLSLATASLVSSAPGQTRRQKEKSFLGKSGRALYDVGDECGDCPFDTYYFYEDKSNAKLFKPIFTAAPSQCVLAPIRDEAALRGAQAAIPKGAIAMTQGYVPFDDLAKYCYFGTTIETDSDDENPEEVPVITGCGEYGYNEFFDNWEDSGVPKDPIFWRNITFPIPASHVHVAIGADGYLRPVSQFKEEDELYTGAIYECCPKIDDVCNEKPPVDSS